VHVERPYTVIARELGIELSNELLAELGGLRADVAIYQDGLPSAIVELKIYDEGLPAYAIAADLFKAQKLVNRARLGNLRAYVGVMICETSNCSLENRARKLEEAIHQKVYSGEARQSVDGQWHWCFGCAAHKDPSA